MPEPTARLLGASQVRELADRLGIRPTKQWGQNFVVDGNTVERIVRVAGVGPNDVVVEVGPGLGSLTLALLPAVRTVIALEVDPVLAAALPDTVGARAPDLSERLRESGAFASGEDPDAYTVTWHYATVTAIAGLAAATVIGLLV